MAEARSRYIPRSLSHAWGQASEQFPVLLLTGPRQVGKTTLLQKLCGKDRRYVTLDDPTLRSLARVEPALFLERFEPPVLIDEIQYAPQLLPHIKMAVDSLRKPGRFWLTGSQQFHMMKGVSETLAGRVAILNLVGLSTRERFKQRLDVEPFVPSARCIAERTASGRSLTLKQLYRIIWTGGFPALASGRVRDRDLFFSSYVQTYLQRDVRDLALVGNETAFLRLVKACAARTAQLLNYSELARDADVSVNTAKHWLSILQASYQVVLLSPLHSNFSKRLLKQPKLYYMDTGLCAYLTEWTTPEALEAGSMSGAILETYAVGELLKSWWHQGREPRLHFYRDKDCREIDVVVVQDRIVYPVEIKKSASPQAADLKAMSSLASTGYKVGPGAVLCLSRQSLPLSQTIQALPVSLV